MATETGGSSMVDEMGLPALVVEGGRPRATREAAALLRLGPKARSDELARMFGLHVPAAAANPIARAVRTGLIVSDRMVITDGQGISRLLEVTTLPNKGGQGATVILLRDPAQPRARRETVAEEGSARRLQVALAVPPRGPGGRARGGRPPSPGG